MEEYTGETQRLEEGELWTHAFLLLDGSGSMRGTELRSGKRKHRAVAEMVYDVIQPLKEDEEIDNILLTVICYDSNRWDDVRVSAYDIKNDDALDKHPPSDEDVDKMDPLRGHGNQTPIGRALKFAREMAEAWVKSANLGTHHRAVICLLTDGMQYPKDDKPDPLDERGKVIDFTNKQESLIAQGKYQGRIRIATVGYYQFPDPHSVTLTEQERELLNNLTPEQKEYQAEEMEGRNLLKQLAFPEQAYFESNEAGKIAGFLIKTMAAESQSV